MKKLIILFFLVSIAGCSKPVMKIGNDTIKDKDFIKWAKIRNKSIKDDKQLKNAFDQFAFDYIVQKELEPIGLSNDSKEILEYMMQNAITNQFLFDEAYPNSDTSVKTISLKFIVLQTKGESELKNNLEKAKQIIIENDNFDKMNYKYSNLKSTESSIYTSDDLNGLFGKAVSDKLMEYDLKIYDQPILLNNNVYIVKVISKNTISQKNINIIHQEEKRQSIEQLLFDKFQDKYMKKLENKYNASLKIINNELTEYSIDNNKKSIAEIETIAQQIYKRLKLKEPKENIDIQSIYNIIYTSDLIKKEIDDMKYKKLENNFRETSSYYDLINMEFSLQEFENQVVITEEDILKKYKSLKAAYESDENNTESFYMPTLDEVKERYYYEEFGNKILARTMFWFAKMKTDKYKISFL